ncbi:hypothetical protein DEO72_LG4g431 [Vigna unguiculata]|uniref:Uncharacterized protein n=1 Tax=Vigna unguiculata TaxID=3917 RepID=A0A4D6LML2_VIGUN|nr:hypothetical protein DEO72_LG4g431 [Vigna unguiculata]
MVWRLAAKCDPLGESYPTEEDWNARHLAARGVPLGNTYTNRGIRGARDLAVRVPARWSRGQMRLVPRVLR